MTKRTRLLLRWGGLGIALAVLFGALSAVLADRPDPSAPAPDGSIEGLTSVLERRASPKMRRFVLREAAAEAGLRFRHFPARRRSLLPEDMGSGLAFGDVDEDGDQDLFLVNFCGALGEDCTPQGRCAFYENEGEGRFRETAAEVGLDLALRGMGAAFLDADGDADLDLYVTAFGANRLLLNDGGRFRDVTAEAGVGDERFGAGVAVADPDLDGDLDVYVCNYVRFVFDDGQRRLTTRQYGSEIPFTLNPSSFDPEPNLLYLNDGSGRFEDAATRSGVRDEEGRSLGAIWFDFDLDGFVDLYVANDVSRNGVFRNRGDGTFEDVGAASLAADYRGAMGLAATDLGGDGDLDLLVTHWVAQENALFENVQRKTDGRRFFADMSESYGLGQISLSTVGWSAGFVDFDLDGLDDLWIVNGSTLEDPEDASRLVPQRLHLYRQEPEQGFFEIGGAACSRLLDPIVGRGGAACDVDGDGRVDLCVQVHGGAPLLLMNETPVEGRHYLVVRLRQKGGNFRALGARVTVRVADRAILRQVGADGAYLSQHPADLHFGLGVAAKADEVIVRWPDGAEEVHRDVPGDRVVVFEHTRGG